MPQVPIFYINLASQPERRAAMERELASHRLVAKRIEAITPATIDSRDIERFCDPRRLFWLSVAELACGLSHVAALRRFLETDAPHALILEDDVVLSRRLSNFLAEIGSSGTSADLIKIESFGDELLVGTQTCARVGSAALHKVYNTSVGSAGYLVSRRGAGIIAASPLIRSTPTDNALFNPHRRLGRSLVTLHAEPGLCIQRHRLDSAVWNSPESSIEPVRSGRRDIERSYRLGYVIRRFEMWCEATFWFAPRQYWNRLVNRATWRQIPYAE